MNRHLIACLVAMCVVIATAGAAVAQQNQASTTADGGAFVVTAIGISKTNDLHFGVIVPGGTMGTVVVTSGGIRSATGGTTLGSGGSATAASFSVTGDPNASFAITLPSSATLTSGANTMVVDSFNSNPVSTGNLGPDGQGGFWVGGTCNMGANQAVGTYSGTFSVTVNYN